MDLSTLRSFEGEVRRVIPSFRIQYKDESLAHKVLGFLSYPFNPGYLTTYTTTWFPTVAFPSREFYESRPSTSFRILSHELVHLYDCRKHGLWWVGLTTAFPQVLSPIALLTWAVFAGWDSWVLIGLAVGFLLSLLAARLSIYVFYVLLGITVITSVAFAIYATGWLSLALLASLLLLVPWPAPGRVHWELRGYSVQLAMVQWVNGSVPDAVVDDILRQFTGPAYFFMSWSKAKTRAALLDVIARAKSGEIQKEAPYDSVYRFALENGLIRSPGA